MELDRLAHLAARQNFYETAWKARLEFVRSLIEKGETNAFRIIKILEHFERSHVLSLEHSYRNATNAETGETIVRVDSGEPQWTPIPVEDPENVLPTGVSPFQANSFLGKRTAFPAYADVTCIVANWIIDLFQDDFDCIVELGAGYGRNLFNIFYLGGPRGIPYYAGEYTNSGCEMARLLGSLEDSFSLRVAEFDHCKPDFSFLNGEERVLAFSCHSIEQVSEIPQSYFRDLSRAAKSLTCLHFEPFGFQISNDEEISRLQSENFLENGWNTNFFSTLMRASEDGEINLTHVFKDIIPNKLDNPTSVALWKNI